MEAMEEDNKLKEAAIDKMSEEVEKMKEDIEEVEKTVKEKDDIINELKDAVSYCFGKRHSSINMYLWWI